VHTAGPHRPGNLWRSRVRRVIRARPGARGFGPCHAPGGQPSLPGSACM